MRHRKTDAHIATVRVSVPIDPMDHLTVLNASAAINGLQAHLPPGSTVEILSSRFGRVDVTVTPADLLAKLAPREPSPTAGDPRHMMPQTVSQPAPTTQLDIEQALAAVRDQVTAGAMPDPNNVGDGLDVPPVLIRRVPRRDLFSAATPMDPSGDGSFRGPDGAA